MSCEQAWVQGVEHERKRTYEFLMDWARELTGEYPIGFDYYNGCISGLTNAAIRIMDGQHDD